MNKSEKRRRFAEIVELVSKPYTPENAARFEELLGGFDDWERLDISLSLYRLLGGCIQEITV